MSSPPELCPLECDWRDDISPGPIGASEELCRGAFSPTHIQRSTGEIKGAVIPSSHLFSGHVSVWRVGGTTQFTFDDVCNEIATRAPADGRVLHMVCIATAEKVRGVSGMEECRGGLCVVDDTDCGNGRHPAHAHIRLCLRCCAWRTLEEAEKDERFQEIRDDLRRLFLSNRRLPALATPWGKE